MAITYRKTDNIKAEQFDGTKKTAEKLGLFRYRRGWYLETLEGSLEVKIGYWIATGVNGEHWPIADDVFKKTYAGSPVIPNYVAEYIDYMKSSYRDIWDAIHYPFRSNKVDKYMEDNSETFARAWLDGYTVE